MLTLKTVTYSLACAPYQVNRTMCQFAVDKVSRFPLGSYALLNNLYMYNILTGADTIEDASASKAQVIELLMTSEFTFSKWTAINAHLLADVADAHRASSQQLT